MRKIREFFRTLFGINVMEAQHALINAQSQQIQTQKALIDNLKYQIALYEQIREIERT